MTTCSPVYEMSVLFIGTAAQNIEKNVLITILVSATWMSQRCVNHALLTCTVQSNLPRIDQLLTINIRLCSTPQTIKMAGEKRWAVRNLFLKDSFLQQLHRWAMSNLYLLCVFLIKIRLSPYLTMVTTTFLLSKRGYYYLRKALTFLPLGHSIFLHSPSTLVQETICADALWSLGTLRSLPALRGKSSRNVQTYQLNHIALYTWANLPGAP